MFNTQRHIQIQAKQEELQGRYSNFFQATHLSREEFLLDFLFLDVPRGMGTLSSRIIVSPEQAKRVLAALQENIKNFESKFGTIEVDQKQEEKEVGFTVHVQ